MSGVMVKRLRCWCSRWTASQPGDPIPASSVHEISIPSGDGPLIWLWLEPQPDPEPDKTASDSFPPSIVHLLSQMRRHKLRIIVSSAEGNLPGIPSHQATAASDSLSIIPYDINLLNIVNPAAILLIGSSLPRELIMAANARHIPTILAETRLNEPRRRWLRLPRRALLSRLNLLLLPDQHSRIVAIRSGAAPDRIEVTGPITRIREPLKYVEAEREALAEAFHGRHLWFAVNITEAEENAVIEAHLALLRYSHRAVLIAMPDNQHRAEKMASHMETAELIVARRNRDDDPTEEVNVYLVDDLYELGLWYRLAPVTFMGTTLTGPTGAARDPFEAASLGSAAIHGPHAGAYINEWAQLDAANGARYVTSSQELTQAVISLLAPDQAAALAMNAWSISTGGAGVANRIAHVIHELISGDHK